MKTKVSILVLTLGLFLSVNSQVPTNGLVGFWPFNGNANDESGNGNNGTVYSATLSVDRFGNSNSAYSFNGTDSYILVPNSTSLKVSNSVTISAWVKNPGDTNICVILTKGTYGSLWDYGLANCWSYTGYYDYNNAFVIKEYRYKNDKFNQWHHLLATVDENNENKPKLFFDGVEMIGQLVTSGNIVRTDDWIRPTDGNILIGSNSNYFFNGQIDDIRIYNRELNSEEIKSLYNEGKCFETVYDTIFVYDTTHVTVYDSISVTDTLIIDVTITTGINSPNIINTIKVYPNPAKNFIHISTGSNFEKMPDYKIKIINSTGNVVYESNLNKQLLDIDVNSFGKTGLFFIQIIDNSNQIIDIRKILLE